MATRKSAQTAAIAASEETAPAVIADTAEETAEETAADETAEETAPALTYVTADGVTVIVAADRVEDLASALGQGRAARHIRALTVGRFIADYVGMTVNRAATILRSVGHYVHRDTVNGAANAYALTVEFMPVDETADPGEFVADVLSLVDAVGIRKIRGTHSNVSVIGYDELSAMTDPTARAAEFERAVRAALIAARDKGTDTAPAAEETAPAEESEETAEESEETAPAVTAPAAWLTALQDIRAVILTDGGALTDAERSALADAATGILSALADTASALIPAAA